MKIIKKLKYIPDFLKLVIAKILGDILINTNKKYKDIWIIGERKNEAKDNGYHLFKYIRENYPNDEVYYVIDKNSKDLEKIKDIGNVLYHDSIKHYIYYVMSSKLICAHLSSCVPDSPVCWKFHEKQVKNKKIAFIQHGIIKETIKSVMYENTKCDLFVCGAKPEYEFVKSEFGYPEGNVQYLGLARFDNLHNRSEKKQILVMPTWRQYIPSFTWNINNRDDAIKIFLESDYYKKFNRLINSSNVLKLLEKYDMTLIFYPHYEMQGYIDLFKSKSEKVIIAKKDEYDVQKLLQESQILITDYSSVAFDFGYMRKPVIYYQFDEEKYYENHYKKGYYDYDVHGFGPKIKSENDLIKSLDKILKYGLNSKYKDRYDEFFPLYDTKNCKRHYDEIKNIC